MALILILNITKIYILFCRYYYFRIKKSKDEGENEKFSIRSFKINSEEFVLDDECTAGSIPEKIQIEINRINRDRETEEGKIVRLRNKITRLTELKDDAETTLKKLNGNLTAAYYNQADYIFFEGNCLKKKKHMVMNKKHE